MKQIKDEVIAKQLAMKIEAQVATSQTLIDMLKKKSRVLHISCHGVSDTENYMRTLENHRPVPMGISRETDPELEKNYLLFEALTGEGELISAAQIKKFLIKGVPMLDLIVIQACQSEIVGRVF